MTTTSKLLLLATDIRRALECLDDYRDDAVDILEDVARDLEAIGAQLDAAMARLKAAVEDE